MKVIDDKCQIWQLRDKQKMNNDTFKYKFANFNCSVRNQYDVSSFGKYFEVQFINNDKIRLYTTLLSQS